MKMDIWYLPNYSILKKDFAAGWVASIALISMKMFQSRDVVNCCSPKISIEIKAISC